MKISILGLGYVGCVSAACLSKDGHEVIGVDINESKVKIINDGKSPIVEPGLEELIQSGRKAGLLSATTDVKKALFNTDVSLICVGTPSRPNGSLELQNVKVISQEIGGILSEKSEHHCIVFRSTVLPGTTRNVVIPILEQQSGKKAHVDFDVYFNPEFLREGSSIKDFYDPPYTIIGGNASGGNAAVKGLYESISAPLEITTYEVAETVKYICNVFHGLKVAFGNEVGQICKGIGIDSHQVMDLFTRDTKLNISPAYLKPGFAFGGSCLPKDLRAILYKSKELDLSTPLLSSVMESNHKHIQKAVDLIISKGKKKIGMLGLSFKEGTDDLRESPTVTLIETLIGKGYQIKIYDSEVFLAKIFGANKEYIQREIPHISDLVCENAQEVIQESEVIVLAKSNRNFDKDILPFLDNKIVVDLIRMKKDLSQMPKGYEGIAW